jgi:hypothetical protein
MINIEEKIPVGPQCVRELRQTGCKAVDRPSATAKSQHGLHKLRGIPWLAEKLLMCVEKLRVTS